MPRERLRRQIGLVVAGWDLLRLELRSLTGNRGLILVLVELAWFASASIWYFANDRPLEIEWFYNGAVVLPGIIPAIALGMAAVMGERDTRQLEVSFSSPGGRYLLWSFRIVAITAALFASCVVMSMLTWLVIDQQVVHRLVAVFWSGMRLPVHAADFPVWEACLHATVPLALVAVITILFSVLFRGAAVAGLLTVALCGISRPFIAGILGRRCDLFFNPFVPPDDLLDPAVWFRMIVFNRALLIVLTALAVALTLMLLQRRERLV